MLKSFNSLLIDKVQCVSSENILPEFFSSPLYVHDFFWHDGLVQEFFSYAYALAGCFFFKITPPPPPPSEVQWSAPKASRVRLRATEVGKSRAIKYTNKE